MYSIPGRFYITKVRQARLVFSLFVMCARLLPHFFNIPVLIINKEDEQEIIKILLGLNEK
jgi:hypothetical protein